jgi:hypothetical protein
MSSCCKRESIILGVRENGVKRGLGIAIHTGKLLHLGDGRKERAGGEVYASRNVCFKIASVRERTGCLGRIASSVCWLNPVPRIILRFS